jgi:hypothetical protein
MPDVANAQIVDTVLTTNETVLGGNVAESQGITNESYAYSISLLMMNAVSTQYSASQIANASVVTTCTQILKAVSK